MSALFAELDILRAWLLKQMLSVPAFRSVFVNRALRLLVIFCFSAALNFVLCLAVPIWMLALGPVVFGVPHVFAGFRYIPRVIAKCGSLRDPVKITKICAFGFFGVSVVRLLEMKGYRLAEIKALDGWEWLALGVFFVILVWASSMRHNHAVKAVVLVPLAYGSWFYPLQTAGFLLLAHNFVGFAYWIQSATNRAEKRTAIFALGLFGFLTALILLGYADGLSREVAQPLPHLGATLDPVFLGQLVFSRSMDFALLDRAVSAYAFGQALHYFVWLKAIPEQNLPSLSQQAPLSFSQSKRAVVSELGLRLAQGALVLTVASILALVFFRIELVRSVYLVGATSHGYLEIAGLPFLLSRRARAS